MFGFAEKMCFVRGDGIQHQDKFFLLLRTRHKFVILLHSLEIETTEPAGQPSTQESHLGCGEPDTRRLVDESLKLLEQPRVDRRPCGQSEAHRSTLVGVGCFQCSQSGHRSYCSTAVSSLMAALTSSNSSLASTLSMFRMRQNFLPERPKP